MVMTLLSQGSHTLTNTLLLHLFYSKWHLQNEHDAALKNTRN